MKKKLFSKHFLIILVLLACSLCAEAQPSAPTVTPYVVACGSTTFNINGAPPQSGQQIKWYSDYYMQNLLYTGNTYTGTATQSQTFYAATYDPATGLQSVPVTAYVFVPKPPVAHAVVGVDPVTNCLGAVNVTVDTTIDSMSTVDIADAYVMLSSPGTNYGTLPYMVIWAGLYHTDDSARLYMKFDLTQIPSNVAIVDSRLTMTTVDGWAHGNNGGVYEHFVSDDSWTETGINWNNKPACTPFNIGWSGGNMGLPVISDDTVNDLWTDFYSPALPNTLIWYNDGNFDFGNMTDYMVETHTSRPNPYGSLGTIHGLYSSTVSEYAGDKILSFVLESPGYDTRWRTKEYTGDETTIPYLNVYFGYNGISNTTNTNCTFSWTGPNGFTSTQQNLVGLQQGNYTLVVTNAYGCTDTTQVAVTSAVISNNTMDTVCTGNSYTFFGHTYNTTGIYSDTLTSTNGCDSIVSLHLYVKPPIQSAPVYDTTCTGVPYSFAGNTYSASGTYADTFFTATGCDSIATLILYVTPPIQTPLYDSICIGGSYVYNGNTYTAAGAYANNFTTATGCDSIVTVNIYVRPADPAPQVTSPVYYCQDSTALPLSINATPPVYWYDTPQGGTALPAAPTPSTTTPGDFSWYVADTGPEGCETQLAQVTVHIYATTDMPAVISPTYCNFAAAMQLQATGSDILWYTSALGGVPLATAPTPSTQIPGNEYYYVTQTINGCESPRAKVDVQVLPPPAPPVPEPDVYCQNQIPQDLNINGDNLLWYVAPTGGTGSSAFPPLAGQLTVKTPFYVSQTVNGCESDRVTVYVEPCCTIELPSAFSPNGDGKNDLFRIITIGEYQIQRFSVYDRWGAEVYEGTGNSAAWDGTINGKLADIGDYYYYIVYTCGASGELSKKGDVTLVR